MEPLIATDWLKDYDPLFDLFDEEMRAGQKGPSDYLNYDYDNINYYNQYKQTDELSIILGLEWMPALDLNSPTASSTSSSAAPSPAISSSACSSTTSYSSAPSPSTPLASQPTLHPDCSRIEPALNQVAAVQSKQAGSSKQQQHHHNHHHHQQQRLKNNKHHHHQQQQQQQKVFRLQPQNHNNNHAFNTAPNNIDSSTSVGNKLNISVSSNGNNTINLINNVDTSTSALKKRKKCLRTTKGTSLLAYPSPKLANGSASSSPCSSLSPNASQVSQNVASISSATTATSTSFTTGASITTTTNQLTRTPIASPLSTLLTFNKFSTTSIVLPTTNIISKPPQCHHSHQSAGNGKRTLASYCAKIEHAYCREESLYKIL